MILKPSEPVLTRFCTLLMRSSGQLFDCYVNIAPKIEWIAGASWQQSIYLFCVLGHKVTLFGQIMHLKPGGLFETSQSIL